MFRLCLKVRKTAALHIFPEIREKFNETGAGSIEQFFDWNLEEVFVFRNSYNFFSSEVSTTRDVKNLTKIFLDYLVRSSQMK